MRCPMSQPLTKHWQTIYSTKDPKEVSWFQAQASTSLRLIQKAQLNLEAEIIDVGGGASVLVDQLLEQGFKHITVLDLAEAALQKSQVRLGELANKVTWLIANIVEVEFADHQFDLWHDRAVFHFLTEHNDQQRYLQKVTAALKSGGYLVISTFAEDGALKCSGLPVQRYSTQELIHFFGQSAFDVVEEGKEVHITPAGNEQKFSYLLLRKK